MERSKLTIIINKPANKIFDFMLNPKNTPLWVPTIVAEETIGGTIKKGIVYKNLDLNGKWSEYTVTSLKKDKLFIFTSQDGNYHVQYRLDSQSNKSTELSYDEWVDSGQLQDPFTLKTLQKLKSLIEYRL